MRGSSQGVAWGRTVLHAQLTLLSATGCVHQDRLCPCEPRVSSGHPPGVAGRCGPTQRRLRTGSNSQPAQGLRAPSPSQAAPPYPCIRAPAPSPPEPKLCTHPSLGAVSWRIQPLGERPALGCLHSCLPASSTCSQALGPITTGVPAKSFLPQLREHGLTEQRPLFLPDPRRAAGNA